MICVGLVECLVLFIVCVFHPRDGSVDIARAFFVITTLSAVFMWMIALINGDCANDFLNQEPNCFNGCIQERARLLVQALSYSRANCSLCHPKIQPAAMHPIAEAIMDGYWH